jgi:translation initiation factor IF-2
VRLRNEAQARRSGRKISFEDIFKGIQEGDYQELELVLKADVSGSLEAFEDEIAKLPQDEIHVNVISSGVGGITESDVMLAAASDAVVLGFNVRPVGDARAAAEREGVEIRHYSVIYRALEDLRDAMTGMLRPEEVEETVGTVEVRQTFRASRVGTIAGCYVTDGHVTRGAKVRIVRDGTVDLRHDDRVAQALQRRRARGRRRLRVRHRPGQLPGRQGGRRARGLRDAAGRAGAFVALAPNVGSTPS